MTMSDDTRLVASPLFQPGSNKTANIDRTSAVPFNHSVEAEWSFLRGDVAPLISPIWQLRRFRSGLTARIGPDDGAPLFTHPSLSTATRVDGTGE